MAKLLGHDIVTSAELEALVKSLEAKITAIESKFKNHKYYLIGTCVLLIIFVARSLH